MDFKETLAKISALNQRNGLENAQQKWKYDINLEIYQFLEASREVDFSHIIGNYPELGQLIAFLSQDLQVLTNPELFRIFLRNLLWFHRPMSTGIQNCNPLLETSKKYASLSPRRHFQNFSICQHRIPSGVC